MVAHDTVGTDPHVHPLSAFRQNLLKRKEVSFLAKDAQTPIGSIQYMIHVPACYNPLWSRHGDNCIHRACTPCKGKGSG
jgi:hypothetical protein